MTKPAYFYRRRNAFGAVVRYIAPGASIEYTDDPRTARWPSLDALRQWLAGLTEDTKRHLDNLGYRVEREDQ